MHYMWAKTSNTTIALIQEQMSGKHADAHFYNLIHIIKVALGYVHILILLYTLKNYNSIFKK